MCSEPDTVVGALELGLGGHVDQLTAVDEPHLERGRLGASDQDTRVTLLELLNVVRGIGHRDRVAGVEPVGVVVQNLNVEEVPRQERHVHVGDLEFAASTRLECFGDLDNITRVEVRPRDCVVGFRFFGLLLEGDSTLPRIELYHPVVTRVGYTQCKDACTPKVRGALAQCLGETLPVEQVVAEHQRDVIVADELLTDDECLGDSLGVVLYGVLDVDPQMGTVTEQAPVFVDVVGCRDDQDVPDTGGDRVGQRVVHAGLVENGQERLARAPVVATDAEGDGAHSGATTCNEDDAFHTVLLGRVESETC